MLAGEVEPRSRTQSAFSEARTFASSARPLERRVSRCVLCAGVEPWPEPVDEPRKIFMKLCATDAIASSRPPVPLTAASKYIASGKEDRAKTSSVQLLEFFRHQREPANCRPPQPPPRMWQRRTHLRPMPPCRGPRLWA